MRPRIYMGGGVSEGVLGYPGRGGGGGGVIRLTHSIYSFHKNLLFFSK